MQMEAGLDSGPVFHRASTPIAPFDTGATLADRLARMGAVALIDTLSLIAGGVARPQPQDESAATYAPKITRESARVVWTRESSHVARVIRAFDPAPGAWTTLDHVPLKLFQPTVLEATGEPGTVLEAGRFLVVACGDGAIGLEQVQPAGKKRLSVEEWVRGRAIAPGARLA
jgi:methionyl-tRNA formyltransferase